MYYYIHSNNISSNPSNAIDMQGFLERVRHEQGSTYQLYAKTIIFTSDIIRLQILLHKM